MVTCAGVLDLIQFLVFFSQAARGFDLLIFLIHNAGSGTSAARDLIQVFAAVDHHPLHRDVVRVQVMADFLSEQKNRTDDPCVPC